LSSTAYRVSLFSMNIRLPVSELHSAPLIWSESESAKQARVIALSRQSVLDRTCFVVSYKVWVAWQRVRLADVVGIITGLDIADRGLVADLELLPTEDGGWWISVARALSQKDAQINPKTTLKLRPQLTAEITRGEVIPESVKVCAWTLAGEDVLDQ
jgi:hypothetical protein